jgi:16S rRNA G527 N7-methylase RsmG
MELILKYFPNLSEQQKTQFAALYDLYTDWNSKINVTISSNRIATPITTTTPD